MARQRHLDLWQQSLGSERLHDIGDRTGFDGSWDNAYYVTPLSQLKRLAVAKRGASIASWTSILKVKTLSRVWSIAWLCTSPPGVPNGMKTSPFWIASAGLGVKRGRLPGATPDVPAPTTLGHRDPPGAPLTDAELRAVATWIDTGPAR